MRKLWSRWKGVVDGWVLHHTSLPKPWALYRTSLRDYRDNWKLILGLLSIVEVPVAILSSTVIQPGTDTASSAYVAFVEVIMNVALIYAIVRIVKGKAVSIREAYYSGSAVIVRLLLVSLILILMMVPLLIGALILSAGLLTGGTALAGGERLLIFLMAVVVSIPSIAMLTRSAWGIFVIFETDSWPWQAVKSARRKTRGKVVILLGRLLALVLLLTLTLVIPAVVFGTLSSSTHWVGFSIILQYLVSIIILPLGGFYLYRLHRGVMG